MDFVWTHSSSRKIKAFLTYSAVRQHMTQRKKRCIKTSSSDATRSDVRDGLGLPMFHRVLRNVPPPPRRQRSTAPLRRLGFPVLWFNERRQGSTNFGTSKPRILPSIYDIQMLFVGKLMVPRNPRKNRNRSGYRKGVFCPPRIPVFLK